MRKYFPCAEYEEDERVSHFEELSRIRRVIGQLEGATKMIQEKDVNCGEIINVFLSVSAVVRNIGGHILKRHLEHCLGEDGFPGTDEQLKKELELALRYLTKLDIKSNQISIDIEDMGFEIDEKIMNL